MISPAQLGSTVSNETPICTGAAKEGAAPFAEALDSAMTEAPTGETYDVPEEDSAPMVTAEEIDKSDDTSSQVSAMLASLSVAQSTVMPLPNAGTDAPIAIDSDSLGGITPSDSLQSAPAKTNVEADPSPSKNSAAVPLDDRRAETIEQPASAQATEPALRQPVDGTNGGPRPIDDGGERIAKPAHDMNTAAKTDDAAVNESSLEKPNNDVHSTRDALTSLPANNAVVVTGALIHPEFPVQLDPAAEVTTAAQKSSCKSLEGVVESPANTQTSQGDDHVSVLADIAGDLQEASLATRNKHPEIGDQRPKPTLVRNASDRTSADSSAMVRRQSEECAATQPQVEAQPITASPARTAETQNPAPQVPGESTVVAASADSNASCGEVTSVLISAKAKPTVVDVSSPSSLAANFSSAQELVQSARMLERAGRSEMQVGVNTEMGRVEVRTVLQNAHVSASFAVERSEMGAMITAELPSLQHALARNHLELSNASVDMGSAGSQSDFNRNAQQQRNHQGTQSYPQSAGHTLSEARTMPTSFFMDTSTDSIYQCGLSVRA